MDKSAEEKYLSIETRIEETQKFITELWGICDPAWLVEIDLLQYRATQENPDAKRMSAMFFTVKQCLDNWPSIHKQLESQNRNQVANVHHCCAP